MKTIDFKKVWIGMLVMPLLMVSCDADVLPGIHGEGDVVTETLMLDDFTGFSNSIAADIYLSQGDEQEVIIEAQQNIIDNLDFDGNDDGFWKIKYDRWVRRAKPIKIYITIPSLDKVSISGAGDIQGETSFTNLENLELKISGAGGMDLDFDCEDLTIKVSGAGDFTLSGESNSIDASISGAGNLRAFDLQTERADFSVSGSGSAKLNVSDYLKVSISGAGSVIYRGTPETDIHVSGSGSVTKDY